MDTSKFLFSRRNVFGVIVALVIILIHLIAGLGVLWPVVALAGWGATVAFLPAPTSAPALPATPSRPGADTLLEDLEYSTHTLYHTESAPEVLDAIAPLTGTLRDILIDWNRLVEVPEQSVVVELMIRDYLPQVLAAYLSVQDRKHPVAVRETVDSLTILAEEATAIRSAMVTNTLRELEDNTRALRMQFGRLPEPGYDTEP